ncbi:DUF4129 domain-containing protein [Microbacterium telephonicum]|uniref:Uncharacterized protein DUF4129 n=1 Tax=Microbacterium telephonicum TaxID=1714841 RepID=A0A498BXS7_9MICO|nr:DUF4129 domain-containing protein [Microbacterium telephonicum]RLK47729.1 uncharacterized protein DUF4129 [Microbacterium telephonicum]
MIVSLGAFPLIPDADEARSWAEQELADPVYRAAEPTWFDRAAQSVLEFVTGLFSGQLPAGAGPLLAIGALVLVAGLVVVALIVWGRPRRVVRSRDGGDLFGEPEGRTAAELRRAAAAAADAARWEDAMVLRLRALARGLSERVIVDPAPGATVHAFARQAAVAFPAEADALAEAADLFDDVRYLRRPGSPDGYARLAALDDRVTAARPVLPDALAGAAS